MLRRFAVWTFVFAFLAVPCWAFQEDEAVPVPDVAPTQGEIVIAAASEDGSEVQMSALAFSTEGPDGGNFFTFAAPVGGATFGGGLSEMSHHLVHDSAIQSEIELTDDQLAQIREMNNIFGKELKSQIDANMRGPDGDPKRLGEIVRDVNRRQAERLGEILVPHQLDRLKQISFQRNERMAGASGVLLSKEIAEQLGIDEEQKEKIRQRAEELRKDFEAKVAELKEGMRKELLEELTPEQQEKIEELRGAKFEFKEPAFGAHFGPPRPRARVERRGQDN